MGYPLNLLDTDEFERRRIAGELAPGDCHYAPWLKKPQHTSERYWAEWAGYRDPIIVRLPGGGYWNIDQKGTHGDGWTIRDHRDASENHWHVLGDVSLLTAMPSVMDDKYHGWLQNGVLSDDIDGRTYE